ncbi:DUF3618 domain-containing protein [Actinomadura rubrisoli]|uniref:DUF3618 domain-containing protein n=1 Tax=Actinomadura rubrisoli TaxID=2530368 RepID=A0A4R5A4X2_9ACTN|nr:DUF3618 domain-containing protein [Actinomadura rubrisoli]TDD65986.1 DUF3618 domain-containing protein [Actinomadura rubrisoli]
MADRARDPEALEREIERTRLELARTIDELADRVNPRNVAHRSAERLKEEAGQVVQVVTAIVRPDGEDEEGGGLDRRVVMAGVGVAVTVTALVLWRRRRKRR